MREVVLISSLKNPSNGLELELCSGTNYVGSEYRIQDTISSVFL